MHRRSAAAVIIMSSAMLTSCASPEFVAVSDGRFVLGDRPHYFTGVNFWQGMNLAVNGPGGDRRQLGRELDRLKQLGVGNLRVMAASEGPNSEPFRITPALMAAPGEYDALVFDGLDYLVAQIGARGMRAVMVLNNFWEWSGGMAQYVSWHEKTPIPYPAHHDWKKFCAYATRFYACEPCQNWFRDHIATVINRTNSYTGRAYREEPAIFAWELANEPRYYPAGWIDETARYIKSLDENHLVTTGSEGSVGGDFISTHDSRHIDYTTIHIWPQNWGWYDPEDPATYAIAEKNARDYFRQHTDAAQKLGKPLVLEEFGLARDWEPLHDCYDPAGPTKLRDRFFSAMFEEVLASASSGGPAGGTNIWAWSGQVRPGDAWAGDPPHEKPGWYSVFDTDASTLAIIAGHSRDMSALTNADASGP